MIWALRDSIDKMNHSRHNNPEVVIENYLKEFYNILDKVIELINFL